MKLNRRRESAEPEVRVRLAPRLRPALAPGHAGPIRDSTPVVNGGSGLRELFHPARRYPWDTQKVVVSM